MLEPKPSPAGSYEVGAPEPRVRVVAFDVDGTLVEHDAGLVVWQILNRRFVGDHRLHAERFRAFQRGELSYAEWVRLDVEGWRDGGATRSSIVKAIAEELRLVPHARVVVDELVRRGYSVAVVSGTLDVVLDTLFPDHPFARVFTNRIAFDDAGAICGWTATPYDNTGKAEALRMLADETGCTTQDLAFVGDHLNDCDAMALAGCPIAYDPKHERVRSLARHVIPRGCLDRLLWLLPGPAPSA
ncbi:MAG: HAD family phosphatase [Polyangiaceae bacterium]|nr:HAD family phosphatase [Polyangiaceae bacterium]